MSEAGAPPAAAPRRSKPLDLAGMLARRGLLILVAGGALAAAVAPALLLVIRPKYVAGAALLVDPGKEVSLTGKERDMIPGDVGDYTRTQIGRMKDLGVLRDALRSLPATNRPALCRPDQSEMQQAVALLKAFTVTETPRTRLIGARLEAETPDALGDTLNAMLETFLTRLQREREEEYASRLAYLRGERARIEARLAAEHARLLALAAPVATKAFLHEGYNIHLQKQEQIQRLLWEAEADLAEKEGLLAKARADEAALAALSLQPYADERVADNFGINRIEQYTYEQLQSMRVTVDGLTPGNQDRQYVEQRMQAMTDYLESYKEKVNQVTIRNLNEKRAHDLRQDVLRATSARDAARGVRDTLAKQLAEASAEASSISETIYNASDVTYSIGQLRERLSALDTRIIDCEMEAKTPPRITIDSRAANPVRPTTNTRPRVLGLSLVMAYGALFGLCLVFEVLDGRIRGRRDVDAALGGRSPDPIPRHDGAGGVPFSGVLAGAPASPAAGAIRRLAARLERERRTHGAQVVVVAGLHRGAGATALAGELAGALAALVERVLLVRIAPEVADTGGLDERPGVTRLERSGPRRDLRKLLAAARPRYDVILLDVPPLHSHDTAQLALLEAGAALLVAREDVSFFRELVGALDVLRAAGIPAHSAVLNRATRDVPRDGARGSPLQRLLARVSRGHERFDAAWRKRRTPA